MPALRCKSSGSKVGKAVDRYDASKTPLQVRILSGQAEKEKILCHLKE